MLITLGLRNLQRNVRRTVALLLTIAVGTGSLFMFHGFNTGIMNQYRDNTIHARFGHGQLNTTGYREHVYERPWEHWIDDWQGLGLRLRQLDGVRFLFPRIEFPALLTTGRVTVSGRGQAVDGDTEAKFFDTMNVIEGTLLHGEADGILLGAGLAHALDVKPGQSVTVMARDTEGRMGEARFTVVGVFHTGLKEFDDSLFRIQLARGQALLATPRIETLALGLRSVDDWAAVQALVQSQFPALEATPFHVLDEVYYQHSVDWLASQFAVINIIILSIATLGIFNTVSTSILERKQEVGNLRANGESVIDVMALLACEGLTLGVLGSALGIVAALVLNAGLLGDGILMPPAPGITRQFRVLIEFQPAMAAIAFGLGVAAALVATVLAGLRVARMPIAQALRAP